MSAQTTLSPRESGSTPSRPRLRAVPSTGRQLATVPFVVVLAAILGVGMVGLLLLNTSLQNQAFQASQLKRQAAEMAYAEGELSQRVVEAGSTTELTRKASDLGLRPNYFVGFLVLPDGRIVGDPKAADPAYLPSAVTRSTEEQAQIRADKARQDAQQRAADERKVLENNRTRIQKAQAKQQADREAELARQQQAAQAQQNQNQAQNQASQPNQQPTTAPTQGSR
ncbi:hypothetical protein [Enemella evansiae]|uniref:Cell division protein FtsL n=1 Tax=Enemella evansiae TaxID=2016499 RepID=A0A255GNX1_9ACTN|nr:hypothetical protein [Enemella evansiae]PFG67915.1 hypothetical protein B0O41_2738 [Propionibacteriaceae bacterium ES.041]OYN95874.1 hypothetical protein CGZ96_15425 [Enemella evansiae]OYO04083.1 hypothetical protein CGZ97_11955 [Enemella evansiae]OYO08580.1 hypothetical protein BI335_20025 [Enemella evansiae]OYO13183.1 hypothetical protein CGZ98_05795 [Enemella evansiae]